MTVMVFRQANVSHFGQAVISLSLIRQKAFPSIQIGGIGYRIPKDTFDSWLHQKENGER